MHTLILLSSSSHFGRLQPVNTLAPQAKQVRRLRLSFEVTTHRMRGLGGLIMVSPISLHKHIAKRGYGIPVIGVLNAIENKICDGK